MGKKFFILVATVLIGAQSAFAAIHDIPLSADTEYLRVKIAEVLKDLGESGLYSRDDNNVHFWKVQCMSVRALKRGEANPAIAPGNYSCRAVTDMRHVKSPAWNAADTAKILDILTKQAGVTFTKDEKGYAVTTQLYLACNEVSGCHVNPNRLQD